MNNESTPSTLNVKQFVELELCVWEALVAGDPQADAAALTDDFVGVYEYGIFGKSEHCNLLENGPIVQHYEILDPRIIVISQRSVILIYLAEWTQPGSPDLKKMYVSSLWQESDGVWKNSFSQDTMLAE